MNDTEIRHNLHKKLLQRHHSSEKCLVVNEMGLAHGRCRADIAVINGKLVGYEIKGETDSLRRLQKQSDAYSKVFDKVLIVLSEKHTLDAMKILPRWWGIVVCRKGVRGAVHFTTQRLPKRNLAKDPFSVAQLLWRSEAVELLARKGVSQRLLRGNRASMYRMLVEKFSTEELSREVRVQLRARRNWRDH